MRPPRGVPRHEWLLTLMLAHQPHMNALGGGLFAIGTDRSAAFTGYMERRRGGSGGHFVDDEGKPDAYAAGAALAMALEGP